MMVNDLERKIDSITIPQKWTEEAIDQPTDECRKLAKLVVSKLLYEKQMTPSRIGATIEEGIFVNYIRANNKHLSIEIYNDLRIAAIVTLNKQILISADITNNDFSEILTIFEKQ